MSSEVADERDAAAAAADLSGPVASLPPPSEDGRSVAEESVAVSTIAMVGSRVTGAEDEDRDERDDEDDATPSEAPSKRTSRADPAEDEGNDDDDDDDDEDQASPAEKPAAMEESPEADAAVIASAEQAEVQAETVPEKEEKAKPPQKKSFVAKPSPKCALCGKSVYKTEEVLDATDTIFHKHCLRCKECKTSLVGRSPVTDDAVLTLSKSQYRPDGDTNALLCDKHAQRTRGTLVQGTLGRDAAEALLAEKKKVQADPALKEKTKTIKQEMEVMVGDAAPVCARCGGPLEGSGAVIVSGLERYHQKCPDQPAEVPRTVRYFVKKVEERPVVLLRDASAAKPVSFLFELDAETKRAALLLKKAELAELTFNPDATARSGLSRKLEKALAGIQDADDDGGDGNDSSPAAVPLAAELRNDDGLASVDPRNWDHAPLLGVAFSGLGTLVKAKKKTQQVAMRLQISPDPVLVLFGSEDDMKNSKKPVLRLLLDANSNVELLRRGGADEGPGFVVTGRAVKGSGRDAKTEDAPQEVRVRTADFWQAHSWAHALEAAASGDGWGADFESGERAAVFRLFAVRGGVLHQYVFAFAYRSKNAELVLKRSAVLFLSEYPEKSVEEVTKADPLAALKEAKREKQEVVEKERLAQLQDAKKQAQGGGSCCVIA